MALIGTQNYVKFIRGTPDAYAGLPKKDSNTLYFISETDSNSGLLYLGDKLIGDGNNGSSLEISLNDLSDILIETIADKQLLVYDIEQNKWINASIDTLISTMVGATETTDGKAGLVPAPLKGAEKKFLRGDGQWVTLDLDEDVTNGILDEVEKRILALDNGVKDLQTQVGKLDASALEGRITELETKSINFETKIGTLENSINEINTTITDYDSRITTIESSVKWYELTVN